MILLLLVVAAGVLAYIKRDKIKAYFAKEEAPAPVAEKPDQDAGSV